MVDNLIVVNYNIFGGFNLWQTMEFILFALVTYGVMWVFIYVIAFLLLIIIMPLMIIWEVGKLIWSIKSEKVISPPINKPATPAPTIKELSKKEKTELMVGLAFVGYTTVAIGLAFLTDLPIGVVIVGWVVATVIMVVLSSKKLERFDDKPINEKENAELPFIAFWIIYTILAIGVVVLTDLPTGFVIASWVVVTAVVIVWLNKIAERFDDKPVDAKEQIDLVFGAVFVSSAALLMVVIFYSNSDALIGFCVAGWLVITAVMGFWAYKKRKRIKNQDQDNP